MRRKDREKDKGFAFKIIDKAIFASLSMTDMDCSPYVIPVSPVRNGDVIYLHGAKEGTKLELIKNNPKVRMVFVGDVELPSPIVEKEYKSALDGAYEAKYLASRFTTYFQSAIIKGKASIVEDDSEKILALKLISEKYTPFNMDYFGKAVEASLSRTGIIRIDIEEIWAKEKKGNAHQA